MIDENVKTRDIDTCDIYLSKSASVLALRSSNVFILFSMTLADSLVIPTTTNHLLNEG